MSSWVTVLLMVTNIGSLRLTHRGHRQDGFFHQERSERTVLSMSRQSYRDPILYYKEEPGLTVRPFDSLTVSLSFPCPFGPFPFPLKERKERETIKWSYRQALRFLIIKDDSTTALAFSRSPSSFMSSVIPYGRRS